MKELDFERIEDKIIEALRADGRFKTVETGQLAGGSMPLRFPAAFVSYDGSKYQWLRGGTYSETIVLSVVVADKNLRGSGGEGAYGLVRETIESLANDDLGLAILSLKPVKVAAVKTDGTISAYRIDFETGFESAFAEETAVKSCRINILESSTVTLDAGTEDPDYPLYRLYDRNIGRIFKAASAETLVISIDQGATGPFSSVDRLVIPGGHNLSGVSVSVKHSEDDVTYTPAVTFTASAGLIEQSWPSIARRYWRVEITSPSAAPEITELFLTSTYEWPLQPSRPHEEEKVFNAGNETTSSGQDRFLIHGEPRERLIYHIAKCGSEQKDGINELYDGWAGSMPFYLFDHEGEWVFVKFAKPVEIKESGFEAYDVGLELMEVLP